jgi:hypothetical protein
VHKSIGLAIIAADEAEAFHRVEELNGTRRLFARELPLRTTAFGTAAKATASGGSIFARRRAILNRERLTFNLEIGCRDASASIHKRKFERLTFGETGKTGLLNGRNVNENILAAIVAHHEAKALLRVEELHNASAFADDLRRHAAAAWAAEAATAAAARTAAETTAAAAATEAAATISVAAAAAAAIAPAGARSVISAAAWCAAEAAATAAAEAVTIFETAAAEIVFAKTVALVSAAPAALAATSFIKTHAVFYFPVPLPCSNHRAGQRANGLVRGIGAPFDSYNEKNQSARALSPMAPSGRGTLARHLHWQGTPQTYVCH